MFIPTEPRPGVVHLAFALAVLLPACFHPTYDHPACGPGGECPAGMTCSLQGFCEVPGDASDASPDASSAPFDGPSSMAPASFRPSNGIEPTLAAELTGTVTISAATTFDVDSGAISGGLTRAATSGVDSGIGYFQLPAFGAGGASLGVFVFHGLTVEHTATVGFTGTRAVVLLIGDRGIIDGTIDVAAGHGDRAAPGPAGGSGGTGTQSARGRGAGAPGIRNSSEDSGGGGGGAGAVGGKGGVGFPEFGTLGVPGGDGGSPYSPGDLEPLQGGSGGGHGSGTFTTDFADGGGGGGALQITALGSLQITGTIDAGGAGGATGVPHNDDPGSGAGGGSGGAVLLESPSVMLGSTGIVAANGGGGGGGGSSFFGLAGQQAHTSAQPAAGGTSGAAGGPAGGAGGALATGAVGGHDGGPDAAGGGGAVGVIVIRCRLSTITGITSPAAVEVQLKPL